MVLTIVIGSITGVVCKEYELTGGWGTWYYKGVLTN
ncbi:hypothetical protein LCGC14_2318110 [marine sediment metagenome]|uniref:Uncharacterized protein n=1 Tax=marine sediment metagenome TaxID=412755 RepID=A0A0F9CIR8_9ZZZZ